MLNAEAGSLYATGANTDVTITLAARAGQRWSIGGLMWSLEGADLGTTPILSVFLIDTTSTNLIWSIDVGDSAPAWTSDKGSVILSEPIKFPHNRAVLFELVAPTGVTGKLNILGAKAF